MVTAKGAEGRSGRRLRAGRDDSSSNRSACASCCCASAVLRRSQNRRATPAPRRSPSAGCTSKSRGAHRAGRRPGGELDGASSCAAVHAVRTAQRVQSRAVLLDDVWSVSGENATRTVEHPRQNACARSWGSVGAYIETSAGSATFVRRPTQAAAVKLGVRTKLFAVSLSLIVLSVLAG